MKRKAFLALGFLALGLGVSQVGPFRARLEAVQGVKIKRKCKGLR